MARATATPAAFRARLLKALCEVNRPVAVCISRDLPLTLPGLEVDGVGTIRLPLGTTQARKLIGQCHQAPYGKGTETLVDTSVRKVWELDPVHLALTNPRWNERLSSIVVEVQDALGLTDCKLAAHLYKLLLYEPGGFFLPHRDGEKLDGMVATLVIALPSVHAGGELIVRHEGQQHELAFAGAASGHDLSYAAFYADCEHEVRPVRKGYRLCLVYNLTLARSRSKRGISALRTSTAVAALGELFGQWPRTSAPKLAVALDHQYSPAGLKIDTLKGVDRTRAEVLFAAAAQAGCVAHLALVTHWQNGSAEGGDDDYSYRRRRRNCRRSEDDEDEEDHDEDNGANAVKLSGYDMGEVFDEGWSIDHWSDLAGAVVALGEMCLDEEEIVSGQPPEAWAISREEFEGYTGNAGMTLERWYHRAAIVVWPREYHFRVLCDAGTGAAIAGLNTMVAEWRAARGPDQERQRERCVQFAEAIMAAWSPHEYLYSSEAQHQSDRALFPRLLQELDAAELVARFLAQVMPRDNTVQLDKSFAAFGRKRGWKTFSQGLTDLFETSSRETIQRNAALLMSLCLDRAKDAEQNKLCRRLTELSLAALEQMDGNTRKHDWRDAQIDRAALLAALVKASVAVEAEETLARLIDHTISTSDKYDLTDIHLKAIFSLESWLPGKLGRQEPTIARWLAHCRTDLEHRTAQAPAPPSDFRRASKLTCTCGDCRELSRFLDDPSESFHHFPRSKDRRQHLHRVIDSCGCDLTHVTTRKGRPFTLVCTKTTASYASACQVYERDRNHLHRLRALEFKFHPTTKR